MSLSQVVFDDKVAPHFLVAKYFLPLIQDKEGTSFTIINGLLPELYYEIQWFNMVKLSMHAGGLAYQPFPSFGHMTIANGALLKLAQVIMAEHKDKPVRINEVI